MKFRLVFYESVGWMVATLALRAGGQYVLRPGDWAGTLLLFGVSFPFMAFLIRRLCNGLNGALVVLAPTLLLDPFSSAFFPVVFPNMAPEVAGVFGGWMLWCCAGGLLGSIARRSTPSR
jgi:Family of unknown function (DUF5367)